MRNFIIIFIWLVFIVLPVYSNTEQFRTESCTVNNHTAFHNLIALFTDRTLYVSGENIEFSISQNSERLPQLFGASHLIYVELITPWGKRIASGKYVFNNNKGSGILRIPNETITGDYYLRAYTRFMRNYGPSSYPSVHLKLVNPTGNSIIEGNGVAKYDTLKVADDQSVISKVSVLTMERKIYGKREKVDVMLNNQELLKLGPFAMCLAVVPDGTIEDQNLAVKYSIDKDIVPPDSCQLQYYPDKYGVTLSGRLVDKENGKPLRDGMVTLSILRDKDFSAYRTRQNGEFNFSLPDYSGTRDVFISAEDIPGKSASLLIDNDFCSLPVRLPSPGFKLNNTEKKAALSLAINSQVTNGFVLPYLQVNDSMAYKLKKSFYGEPSVTLNMDQYIQLPTLEEYFNELPIDVKVREKQGKKYFKFLTPQAEMQIYNPLVLIDWISVTDLSKLLAVSPQKIDRIEIINKPYVKGDITYGGVVSIISRNGDFAGIDLPTAGVFFHYDLLYPYSKPILGLPAASPRLPDSRNTLYWDPDFEISETEDVQHISFYTSDTPGQYLIKLMGIGTDGKIIQDIASFEVIVDK